MLDYLWAGLPIVATTGDSFAELIDKHQLGIIVPYQNEEILAQSLLSLLNDHDKLEQIKSNINTFREQFYWQSVIIPLQNMIERLLCSPKPHKKWQNRTATARFLITKIFESGITTSLKKAGKYFFPA